MFQVKREKNRIYPLQSRTFTEENFEETPHLQEWLANLQEGEMEKAFGEKLLIIQKEFSGFDKTQDKLDLLALDKKGSLVIIENKRDDSGKEIVGQALRYVAYCSTMTKSEIVEAFAKYSGVPEEEASGTICNFLGADDIEGATINSRKSQRFILVARKFSIEATSSVLWLLSNDIKAQCMKTSLFRHDNHLFFDMQQIIPPPEAKEYMVRMSSKDSEEKQEEVVASKRKEIYYRFWAQMLEYLNKQNFELFQNHEPVSHHQLWKKAGIKGCCYMLVFKKFSVSVEFYIGFYGEQKENSPRIFELLKKHQQDINANFKTPPTWEKTPKAENFHIYLKKGFDSYNDENWQDMIKWLHEHIDKLTKALDPVIPKVQSQLDSEESEQA